MGLTLAFLEGGSLFVLVCTAIFLWGRPLLGGWLDLVTILGQAGVLSLCCIATFYYNDLYDLRIARNLGEFASRLFKALGIAFFLLALLYAGFPRTKIARRLLRHQPPHDRRVHPTAPGGLLWADEE